MRLEQENSHLKEFYKELNEFKLVIENHNQDLNPSSIDKRRLLILKSQVIHCQRQNRKLKDLNRAQENLSSSC